MRLPPMSSNLNAYAVRFVCSIKDERLASVTANVGAIHRRARLGGARNAAPADATLVASHYSAEPATVATHNSTTRSGPTNFVDRVLQQIPTALCRACQPARMAPRLSPRFVCRTMNEQKETP